MTTKIEWTDETWSPVTGCTKISPGCAHCYAEHMARRLAGRCGYPESPHHFDVTLHPDRLNQPLRWRKPRMIFVCSMSDLFHEDIPTEFIIRIFDTIRATPHHIYQILTKRPARMLSLLKHSLGMLTAWPLPGVWLGVTVENQKAANERIPLLLQTPAAVRFVSCEPLLGPLNLSGYLSCPECGGSGYVADGRGSAEPCGCNAEPRLDWVIVGGESGPGARPMHPDWVRSLRDQCQSAGVSFFFKQWGEWLPNVYGDKSIPNGTDFNVKHHLFDDGVAVARVGKKAAGRLLDGRTWDEMPRKGNTQ